MQVCRNVTGNEVGGIHQIGGADAVISKTEVRTGKSSRFLGVVSKIGLHVLVGIVSDNLDGVFVGPNRSVGPQPVKLGFVGRFIHRNLLNFRQRFERHIIHNSDGEIVFRQVHRQVVVHRDNLSRSSIFRRQTVNTSDDHRSIFSPVETVFHIQIKRLSGSAGFFCPVENGNSPGCFRDDRQKCFGLERTIQVNGHHTHFFTVGVFVVNHFADGFGNGTHGNNYSLRLGIAVIVKQSVLTAGDGCQSFEVFLNNTRNSIVKRVSRFTGLEINIVVLSRSPRYRRIGAQRPLTESG